MAFYYGSWFILFAPLFSFAVIVFGTRIWDVLVRPNDAVQVDPMTTFLNGHAEQQSEQEGHAGETGEEELAFAGVHGTSATRTAHGAEEEGAGGSPYGRVYNDITYTETRGPHGETLIYENDDNPKVAHLTPGAKASAYVGLLFVGLAAIYSWLLLLNTAGVISIAPVLPQSGVPIFTYNWFIQSGSAANYVIAFQIDRLAIAMMVVVTTVSFLVHFYSRGYMENSAGYARFYAYLSLFTFSMLDIVFAQNFLVIFVGWELVGLSSYLLIGFWFNKRAKPAEDRLSPATAAIEAFIANRVGDVGFIIGIMILFANTGTFDFPTLASKTSSQGVIHAFAGNTGLLTLAMILVFCGAIGKSAQVPLHVWLPPAMEGPTPVSALIHAATMVAAGIYMVARTFSLFAAANPAAFQVVAWVGGITAIFAALIALCQSDFKRVLAFSTISQLGYMFVGLGVAGTAYGPGPGMFHLFTHAFFKALLFLGAGSVIESLHHATHREVQDMNQMGGLAKFMPITAATWLIACFSISGFPFFAGFFSKDSIIGLAFDQGDIGLYVITLLTAGLTAFYMFRAFFLAFGGKGGDFGGIWGGPYRGEGHPHESPLSMTIPLILLAVASVVAGYWFGFYSYLTPGAPILNFGTILSDGKTWIGVVVALVGIAWAYTLYCRVGLEAVHNYVESHTTLRVMHRILWHKFYVDDFYNLLIRYGVLGISHIEQAFDAYIVDGIVNGVAQLVMTAGRDLRHVETGKVQTYMVGFFGGVAVLAALIFVLVTFVR